MAVDYTKLTASTLVRIGFIRDVTLQRGQVDKCNQDKVSRKAKSLLHCKERGRQTRPAPDITLFQ